MSIWHVYPQNDLKLHNTDNSVCDCEPKSKVMENGDLMIIHNSYDSREEFENLIKDFLNQEQTK